MTDTDREYIKKWFRAKGSLMCAETWRMLQDLYIECVLYTKGGMRCSNREFGQVLSELGCEYKRVADGMAYRFNVSE